MPETPNDSQPAKDAADAAPASEEPRRIECGDVLAGKYRVERVLGEGGMGQVLEAVHIELEQRVAVKALLPKMVKHAEAVARFMREAKVLAKLQSEHVARVFDVGQADSGQPFMVMELLEGSNLADLVDATTSGFPVHEACELTLHICAGLADVHAAGIVHRDLKPSNCMVVRRQDGTPSLKLLDFGISKFRGTAVTQTAAIMGSPGYMSPEQMVSTKDVDERADIWALGATFYEMLTGRPAFLAENAPLLCLKIANEEPDPPRKVNPAIPTELEAVVLRCLEKVPEQRYADVAEVAAAIAPYAPERARSYGDKVRGILGKPIPPAASSGKLALAQPGPRRALEERATVLADVSAGGVAADARPATSEAVTVGPRTKKRAASEERTRPRSRWGSVLAFFVLLGGAGAATFYARPNLLASAVSSFVDAAAALAPEPETQIDASAPPTPPSPSTVDASAAPGATVLASLPDAAVDEDASAESALDAGDLDGSADDEDDDDDDAGISDGGPEASANASPQRKPAKPKKKPKPHRPKKRHR